MTATTAPTVITEPGLYDGMAEDVYHADPVPAGSLSSTGARELLACPARYAWAQEHGRPDTKAFDLGKVVHAEILGTGARYITLPFENWTTRPAQKARDAARAEGLIPLTTIEREQVRAIVAAFLTSPAASLLTEDGDAERSIFWIDDETGVWCRARLDWSNGLTTIDVKTAEDASRAGFSRDAARYRYHVQYAMYLRGIRSLGLAGRSREPEFVFAVVEKRPPYLVGTYILDAEAATVGDELVSRALRRFAECQRTGVYPGYPAGIVTVSLPRWATYLPEELS